jgi:hypothetical protein
MMAPCWGLDLQPLRAQDRSAARRGLPYPGEGRSLVQWGPLGPGSFFRSRIVPAETEIRVRLTRCPPSFRRGRQPCSREPPYAPRPSPRVRSGLYQYDTPPPRSLGKGKQPSKEGCRVRDFTLGSQVEIRVVHAVITIQARAINGVIFSLEDARHQDSREDPCHLCG